MPAGALVVGKSSDVRMIYAIRKSLLVDTILQGGLRGGGVGGEVGLTVGAEVEHVGDARGLQAREGLRPRRAEHHEAARLDLHGAGEGGGLLDHEGGKDEEQQPRPSREERFLAAARKVQAGMNVLKGVFEASNMGSKEVRVARAIASAFAEHVLEMAGVKMGKKALELARNDRGSLLQSAGIKQTFTAGHF